MTGVKQEQESINFV